MEVPRKRERWWPVWFGLFLAVCILYSPSLRGAPVLDDHYILRGTTTGGGELFGVFEKPFNFFYYRPLTSLSFYVDLKLYGGSPGFYHQTNILLFAIETLLVAWLACLVSRRRLVGVIAAALFAIQPAQTGAVAWIGGRTDTLAGVFVVLSFGCLVSLATTRRPAWLLASVFAYFCAAMAKEQAATTILAVPFVLRAYGYRWRTAFAASLCYMLALGLFAYLWVWHAGAVNSPASTTLVDQLVRAGQTAVSYFLTLVIPTPQGLFSYSLANWAAWHAVAGLTLLAAAIVGVVWLWRRNAKYGALAIAALAAYLPIANVAPLPSLYVASYRLAIAGIFCAVLASIAVSKIRAKSAAGIVVGAYGAYCIALVIWGTNVWQTELGALGAYYKFDPYSIASTRGYAGALYLAGRYAEEGQALDKVLDYAFGGTTWKNKPSVDTELSTAVLKRVAGNEGAKTKPRETLSALLHMRAAALAGVGEMESALTAARASISVDNSNVDALLLAGGLLEDSDPDAAAKYLERAYYFSRNHPTVNARLAQNRVKQHRYKEAIALYRAVVAANRKDGSSLLALARLYWQEGKRGAALEALAKARDAIVDPAELREVEKLLGDSGLER
jgi:tetratricopeptide (TPR) repeat protein